MPLNAGRLLLTAAALLSPAVATNLLSSGIGGGPRPAHAAAAGAAAAAAFPFRAPDGATWVGEPDVKNHFCFRFVYAVVKDFPLKDHKGKTFADRVGALCHAGHAAAECKSLALSLQDIVEAKEERRSHKTKRSYEAWCSKFSKSPRGRTLPTPKEPARTKLAKPAVVAPAARAVKVGTRPMPKEPAQMKVTKPAPTHKEPAKVTKPAVAAPAMRSKKVDTATHAQQVAPAAPSVTPTPLAKQVHFTTHATPAAIAAAATDLDEASLAKQAALKRRAASDPEHCSCVHRDGKEVCKCHGA